MVALIGLHMTSYNYAKIAPNKTPKNLFEPFSRTIQKFDSPLWVMV